MANSMHTVDLNEIMPPSLLHDINLAIEREIKLVIEEEIVLAQQRTADRVRKAVGGIASRVLEKMHFERHGQELIIRVDFAFPQEGR